MPFDISVVVSCGSQGRLLHATTKTVEAAVLQAEQAGLSVEWLFALQNSAEATNQYFQKYLPAKAQVVASTATPLDDGRNEAIRVASGKWLSLVDGDHLWSSDWLCRAFDFANTFNNQCIFHSELKVFFGKDSYFARNVDQESGEFSIDSLFEYNYWNSSTFSLRELYLQHEFTASNQTNELRDWGWNCETVAAGVLHKVVPGTIHAIRVKNSERLIASPGSVNSSIPQSNDLFKLSYQKIGRR